MPPWGKPFHLTVGSRKSKRLNDQAGTKNGHGPRIFTVIIALSSPHIQKKPSQANASCQTWPLAMSSLEFCAPPGKAPARTRMQCLVVSRPWIQGLCRSARLPPQALRRLSLLQPHLTWKSLVVEKRRQGSLGIHVARL